MNDRWYYAHDNVKFGPVSSRQMMDLAVAGQILRTDTVWKEGVEKGVSAQKVQHLFPPAAGDALPVRNGVAAAAVSPPSQATALPDDIDLKSEVQAPAAPTKPGSQQQPPRKLRAVAVKGATIVSQDGATVKYRKKCMECGHEDASYNAMRITNGTMTALLICPKCRKKQEIKMKGFQG